VIYNDDIKRNFLKNAEPEIETQKPIFKEKIEEKSDSSIINIEINKLVAFRKRQPFSMYDENKKQEVLESIRENGVLVPIIIRKIDNDKYEIISGHNRVQCCKELGLSTIPAQIVDCNDNKATLIMIDTNLCNRDKIPPVEKGYAYKLKMEILKNNSNISNINDYSNNSHDENLESTAQIYRYIRLTELIKALQIKVNAEQIILMAGVELSYLSKEEQEIVDQVIEDKQIKLSLVQAQKIKMKKNNISYESVLKILNNEKEKIEKFRGKLSRKFVNSFKDKFTNDKEFEELMYKLLAEYFNKADTES